MTLKRFLIDTISRNGALLIRECWILSIYWLEASLLFWGFRGAAQKQMARSGSSSIDWRSPTVVVMLKIGHSYINALTDHIIDRATKARSYHTAKYTRYKTRGNQKGNSPGRHGHYKLCPALITRGVIFKYARSKALLRPCSCLAAHIAYSDGDCWCL